MAYYVVVHHPSDLDKPYTNEWNHEDKRLLQIISTTPTIAERCEEARQRGERVFVHRCRWHDYEPVICCSVRVKKTDYDYPGKVGWVEFEDAKVVMASPIHYPRKGDNSYEAHAPEEEST